MVRRALTLLLTVMALGIVVAPAPAQSPSVQRRDNHEDLRFLDETLSKVRRYHIHGREHDNAEYYRGAAAKIADELEAESSDEFGAIPLEKRRLLAAALRREGRVRSFEDIYRLTGAFREYVHDIDTGAVTDFASQGVVAVLKDPFSRVLNREQFDRFQKMMRDQRNDRSLGLGLRKNPETKAIEVAFVQWGTIGYDFGFENGDVVLAIDGKDPTKLGRFEVRELLQRDPGERFTMTVMRKGWKKPQTLHLVQQNNPDVTVYFEMLPGDIGYIRATMFDVNLGRRMDRAIDALKRAGMRALVLDLRNNPGGALQSCLAVADDFIDGGKTITTLRNRYPFNLGDQVLRAADSRTRTRVPMVCLINKHSASAAEMLSGALRDTGRATVMGEVSFGKGVGQAPIPSSRRRGQRWFYLTTLEYFLPDGESIQHKGVVPNIEVKAPRLKPAESEKLFALRDSRVVDRYIEETFDDNRAVFRRGVSGDVLPASEYPGLVEYLEREGAPRISPRNLALEVRRELRRWASKKGGRRLVTDLNTDVQLVRARRRLLRTVRGGK